MTYSKGEFKEGDRVAVYGTLQGDVKCSGDRGRIVEAINSKALPVGWYCVEFERDGTSYWKYVHPKQLRRLKPKKSKRREWYAEILIDEEPKHVFLHSIRPAPCTRELIQVREVRPSTPKLGKRVSRTDLANAIYKELSQRTTLSHNVKESAAYSVCDVLGVTE